MVPASLSAGSSPSSRLLPAMRPCLLPGPGNVSAGLLSCACELRAAACRASGTVAAPVPAAGMLPIVGCSGAGRACSLASRLPSLRKPASRSLAVPVVTKRGPRYHTKELSTPRNPAEKIGHVQHSGSSAKAIHHGGRARAYSGIASANDDQGDDWRDKALALNDVTGDDPIKGEIQNWTKKPGKAKQLLSTATSIAKEKNQPLNYNAAYILASVALNLKDYHSGQTFFQLCAEQAFRLRSGQKLVQAYLGLANVIDGLTGKKDYDRAAKVCQEFLETLEREHAGDGLKNDLMRRLVRALAKQGKKDEAWRIMDNMLKVRGSDWRNLELKAWLQQETSRTAELAHTYEELQEQISKDGELDKDQKAELIADVRRQLIRALVKQEKADEAGAP